MAAISQMIWNAFFQCNEKVWILTTITLKFVRKGVIDNELTLVQVMAWCQLGRIGMWLKWSGCPLDNKIFQDVAKLCMHNWSERIDILPHFTLNHLFPEGTFFFNSMRPRDAYMCWQLRPSLVKIIACRLFHAKPLPEPMLPYCQLDPRELTSVKS